MYMYAYTHIYTYICIWGSSGDSVVKNLPANAGDIRDAGLIPRSGRCPGRGHGNPFQYSCLGNPMTKEPGQLHSWGHKKVGHELPAK